MTAVAFTVRGHRVRSASSRRFLVVVVREKDFVIDSDTYVACAYVARRSDSLATAETHARRMRDRGYRGYGLAVVVVDSTTGEEV